MGFGAWTPPSNASGDWTNSGRVTKNDGLYAESSTVGHVITCDTFPISFPVFSGQYVIIDEIEVRFDGKVTGFGGSFTADAELSWNSGTDYTAVGADAIWTGASPGFQTLTFVEIPANGKTWGRIWTPGELASPLRMKVTLTAISGFGALAGLDVVQIRVDSRVAREVGAGAVTRDTRLLVMGG